MWSILILVVFMYSSTLAQDDDLLTIKMDQGQLHGKSEFVPGGQDVEMFLGIPYAEPPVGELRFAAPRPPKTWKGVRDATKYGSVCQQPPNLPVVFQPITDKDQVSEDCLYLNLYRPAGTKPNHSLPVMVWIHGGGLYRGSGNFYDGSVLASHNDVIIVTFNYRLALLGFFAIPGTELKGNYGMLDQVQALKWVQQNIASFGGSSSRVTIFGQSAGGTNVGLLIVSPLSKGLFNRAILQSGTATTNFGASTPRNKTQYDRFLVNLDCNDKANLITCLRGKDAAEFDKAVGLLDVRFSASRYPAATVDGEFLPDEPNHMLETGQFNQMDAVMIGVTQDEGMVYSPLIPGDPPFSKETFHTITHDAFFTQNGECDIVKQAALHQYANHSDPADVESMRQAWYDIISDAWFIGPAVHSAMAFVKAGIPTYFYQFSHRSTHSVYPPWMGACHFDDVQYVFGSPWKPNPQLATTTGYTDMEKGLSSFMMKLWTGLAKNTTLDDLVTWPHYTAESQEYLDIGLVPSVKSKLHVDRVAFWNQFVPLLKTYCAGRGEDSVPPSQDKRIEL